MLPNDDKAENEIPPEKEGEERRVSLSITVRPSTRARLEVGAVRKNNTISRLVEMATIAWLDSEGI